MSDEDERQAVVVDNGTGELKVGLGGEDEPNLVFRSCIGRSGISATSHSERPSSRRFLRIHYIGSQIQNQREILSLSYPMEHGIITNWDDMEKIWMFAVDSVGVNLAEHPILVSEAPLNPKANSERMLQVLFESLHASRAYVVDDPLLAMYAASRSCALVVSCGYGVTSVTPIWESRLLPQALQRVDFAGQDLTQILASMLAEKGFSFSTARELEILNDVKEKHCYVSSDFSRDDLVLKPRVDITLPGGGAVVTLQDEVFRCPETLFTPSLAGGLFPGLHQLVGSSLMACDVDTRGDLLGNILLCGGSTMMPGLGERLQAELDMILPTAKRKRVLPNQNRKLSVWLGGSILSSLSFFRKAWITRERYMEEGPRSVRKILSAVP